MSKSLLCELPSLKLMRISCWSGPKLSIISKALLTIHIVYILASLLDLFLRELFWAYAVGELPVFSFYSISILLICFTKLSSVQLSTWHIAKCKVIVAFWKPDPTPIQIGSWRLLKGSCSWWWTWMGPPTRGFLRVHSNSHGKVT